MKKPLFILPLVLLLCFTFSCQKAEDVAEEPAVDIAAEREAVRQAIEAWNSANNSKDLEGMLASVAEDALFTSGEEFLDKKQSGEFWSSQFSQGNYWTSYPPEKLEVSASGDLAYAIHRFEFTSVVEGESETSKGTFCSVWKKQVDGSWKMVSW
jgi:uncharacterized protein (TIGR02246 family)